MLHAVQTAKMAKTVSNAAVFTAHQHSLLCRALY